MSHAMRFADQNDADIQMGSMYPLRVAHWSSDHFVLSPNQEDKSGTRDGGVHLCGNGSGSDHPVESRTFDQRNAGE